MTKFEIYKKRQIDIDTKIGMKPEHLFERNEFTYVYNKD